MRRWFVLSLLACMGYEISHAQTVRPHHGAHEARAHEAAVQWSPDRVFSARVLTADEHHFTLVHAGDRCSASRVLVWMPGLGEARRGEQAAIWGFWTDYDLPRALQALERAVLVDNDFAPWPTPERTAAWNRRSRASLRTFALVTVAPPAPPYRSAPFSNLTTTIDHVLTAVAAHCPNYDGARERTHIDGISLGGWLALEVAALSHRIGFADRVGFADRFGFVGATQPAIAGREAVLVEGLTRLVRQHPQTQIRLLTSNRDPYRPAIERFHQRLHTQLGSSLELDVVQGTHSYTFNRGPGLMEILLWHATRAAP